MSKIPLSIQALRLCTIYEEGATSLVSLAERYVMADFDGREPQADIPHLDFDGVLEQRACEEFGMDAEDGFPGWDVVFDFIAKHPELLSRDDQENE